MLDPYAPVATRVQLPNGVNVPPPKKGLPSSDAQTNPPALMGCLSSLSRENFDWGDSKSPKTPLAETLVLELDVPSLPSTSNAEHKGQHLLCTSASPQLRLYTIPIFQFFAVSIDTEVSDSLKVDRMTP